MNKTGKTILTFLGGAAAGVVTGLLIAPKTGKDTRGYLGKKTGQLKQTAQKSVQSIKKIKDATVIPIEQFGNNAYQA